MPNIQTPYDIGQTIKSRRKQLGWDQAQLADKIGVSRQWIINIEQGKPRAEIGLILRALHALELPVFIGKINAQTPLENMPDIDKIIEEAKNQNKINFLEYPKSMPKMQKVMEPVKGILDSEGDLKKILDNPPSQNLKDLLQSQREQRKSKK